MNDYPVNVFLSAPARILLAILVFVSGSGVGQIIALMSMLGMLDWLGIESWWQAITSLTSTDLFMLLLSPLIVVGAVMTGIGLIFPIVNFFVFWKNLTDSISNCRALFIYAINQVLMFGLISIWHEWSSWDWHYLWFPVQAAILFTLIYFGHKLTVSAINKWLLPFLEQKFNKEET